MEIVWNENYSVKIKEIDEQHKKLINLFNNLHSSVSCNEGKEKLKETLDGLIEYTRTHFHAEEKLMKDHGYPEYEQHKKIHDDLTNKVLKLQSDINNCYSISVLIDAMKFLTDWLIKHILATDMKYSPFLSSKVSCQCQESVKRKIS